MAGKSTFIVNLINTCVVLIAAITALYPAPARANPACRRPFESALVQSARWLAANRLSIDPAKTHLAPLAPVTQQILLKVESALAAKANEINYRLRAPLVRQVLGETRRRIDRGTLTYEYLFALPYRLGFLMAMRGTPNSLTRGAEPALVFHTDNYVHHDSFMKMMDIAAEIRSTGRPSIYHDLRRTLSEFPISPLIPVEGAIDHETPNTLISIDIWPHGISTSKNEVDGVNRDEFGFPLHDHGHWLAARSRRNERFFQVSVPYDLIRAIDRTTLTKLETLRESPDFNILQFIHHQVFHESIHSDFTLSYAGGATTEVTVESVSRAFETYLRRAAAGLAAPFDPDEYSWFFYQRDLEGLLRSGDSRAPAVARVIPIYHAHLKAAIDSQAHLRNSAPASE